MTRALVTRVKQLKNTTKTAIRELLKRLPQKQYQAYITGIYFNVEKTAYHRLTVEPSRVALIHPDSDFYAQPKNQHGIPESQGGLQEQ